MRERSLPTHVLTETVSQRSPTYHNPAEQASSDGCFIRTRTFCP
eukprot:CAMPEP_0183370846 /NCGR_PEP_ID=MMETSP0164_2-20130417/103611_1 /TAXON_ID=221442 /ORGANISM="Coccolithus pelagicus ssp braarudi, Strain PLY182g" /LENGTH=43 /DNA_ID= /DNA_START= /DNA_END= /DNA_ORIENTATION=